MKWQSVMPLPIILQVFIGFTMCSDEQPKSRIMDLLSGITKTSKNVIMGTVGRVRDILPPADKLPYPDDSVIYELFEYFKDKMKFAHPDLDLPALDPFAADHLEGDIVNDIIGNISIHLQDINITRLSQFEINKVKMNWLPRKLDVNLTFPKVEAHGLYSVSGLLGNMIPIHGNGPVKISIKNINCSTTTQLSTHNNFIYMHSMSLNYSVEEVKVNLTNLMGGGRLGELLNKVLSQEAPQILNLVRRDLTYFGESWLNDSGNNILTKLSITINGVLDFLQNMGRRKVSSIFRFSPFKSEL